METKEINGRIAEVSRSILSFCMSRTSSQQDAEDLSQDILLELVKSLPNIRDDKAFYKFMWAIADNTYKKWCAKKARTAEECVLNENISMNDRMPESLTEDSSDLHLLRRELAFLNEKSRKAMILYYLEKKSCSEISSLLKISESMVKYLLFKSRKKLKEGMNMERIYGELSYNPKKLQIISWGEKNPEPFWAISNNLIQQNIIMACYNDILNTEEISLQIGVPLSYLEKEISHLIKLGALILKGNKYSANLIVETINLKKEINAAVSDNDKEIAALLADSLPGLESEIRRIGFQNNDIKHNSLMWLVCSIMFYEAENRHIQKLLAKKDEKSIFGTEYAGDCFRDDIYLCSMFSRQNDRSDSFVFVNAWRPETQSCFIMFVDNHTNVNIFLDIAGGSMDAFSENDKLCIAEMIKTGLVKKKNERLSIAVPVFSEIQKKNYDNLLKSLTEKLNDKLSARLNIIKPILMNHVPGHLSDYADNFLHIRTMGMMPVIELLCDNRFLKRENFINGIPSIGWVVLKDK